MQNPIIDLRRELHQYPDCSGAEEDTAARVQRFLKQYHAGLHITELAGAGFMAEADFGPGGKTVVLRCELDALPIAEPNTFAWKSRKPGASHKCGHDGHMAMVAGLALWLQEAPFAGGKVVLLFQPAEETGTGAALICEDPQFHALQPDYVFALHNIPGAPMGTIIGLPDYFSAEVISCVISLQGKEAHAAEPENGRNPAFACADILARLGSLAVPDPDSNDFSVLTPVHCRVGEQAYGIAPGQGELHYTIRTWSAATMATLRAEVAREVAAVCHEQQLEYTLSWLEHFPASQNDPEANARIGAAARRAGLPWQQRPHPFRFGEDFGWFSRSYKTAMFGLGAGLDTPALHHADYDFPDELLPFGMAMYQELITAVLTS